MSQRISIYIITLFLFLGACNPNLQTEKPLQNTQSGAVFKGVGPTEKLYFEKTDLELKDMMIAFEDVGHRLEICEKANYYLCIESPLELYIPIRVGTYNFENSKGEDIEVTISTHKEEAGISQICELERFWVTVRNDTSKYTGNFHFDKVNGLVALFETLRLDDENYEPVLGYSLDEGNVFEMASFCGKGSD